MAIISGKGGYFSSGCGTISVTDGGLPNLNLVGDVVATGALDSAINTTFTLTLDQIANSNDVDFSSFKLLNVATPTANSDGANKAYVDGKAQDVTTYIDNKTWTTSQITDFNTAITQYRLSDFLAPVSNIDLNNQRITNAAYPVNNNDYATKQFVIDQSISPTVPTITLVGDVTGSDTLDNNIQTTLNVSNLFDNVIITSSLESTGPTYLTGQASNIGLSVTYNAEILGELYVNQKTLLDGNLVVTGHQNGYGLEVFWRCLFHENLEVEGDSLLLGTLDVRGDNGGGFGLEVANGANIQCNTGSFNVQGTSNFDGLATFNGRMVVNSSSFGSAYTFAYGYLNSGGNTGTSSGTNTYALVAYDRVAATEFNAFSSIKKKNVQSRVLNNPDELKELYKRLQFVKYQYKDQVKEGYGDFYGVIAEEVHEVFANLVDTTVKDHAPSILQTATMQKYGDKHTLTFGIPLSRDYTNDTIFFHLGKLNVESAECFTAKVLSHIDHVLEIEIIDQNKPIEAEPVEVFVYGEHTNVPVVIKDKLHDTIGAMVSINVRDIEALQTTVQSLTTEVQALKTQLKELKK